MIAANDNSLQLVASIDHAVSGQAITLRQSHRKHGKCWAEFIGHTGDGKHILARKLISSTWRSRFTKPLTIARSDVIAVHTVMATLSDERN